MDERGSGDEERLSGLFAVVGSRLESGLAAVLQQLGRFLRWVCRPMRPFASWVWRKWLHRCIGRITETVSPRPRPFTGSTSAPPSRERHVLIRTAVICVLVVLVGGVRVVLARVDSALQQMHLAGGTSGSALAFPVSVEARERVIAVTESWQAYDTDVARLTVLRSAVDIARALIVLDLVFIALYAMLLIVVIMGLHRINAHLPKAEPAVMRRRSRYGLMLIWAGVSLALLVVVDVAEDFLLLYYLVGDRAASAGDWFAIGPMTTLFKYVLAFAVLVPVLPVAVAVFIDTPVIRRTLWTTRAVVLAAGLLAVLLFAGIGAGQVDDVIRAWDGVTATCAIVAALLLALTVSGVTRELSGPKAEGIDPDAGQSSQPLLIAGGLGLVVVGLLSWSLGFGWGICVAGVLLLVLWFLGVLIAGLGKRPDQNLAALFAPDKPAEPAAAPPAGAEAAEPVDPVRHGAAGSGPHPMDVAVWGDRLGRFLGAGILVLLVWVIARATALVAYARSPVQWGILVEPLVAAAVLTVVAAVLAVVRVGEMSTVVTSPAPVRHYRSRIWFWTTLAAFAVLAALWFDQVAVTGAQKAGTVAVVLTGFALLTGLTGLIAGLVRTRANRFALPPALRVVGLRRFPALAFLIAWVLVVSILDDGGFHDVRRDNSSATASGPASLPPTIGAAWEQWVAAASQTQTGAGRARPVVLVAAQGGGIRAAVWTALVMECLFGPGPVRDSDDNCAAGSDAPQVDRLAQAVRSPTPVYLASGASGGSLGLAAWSARRADLVQDGAASRTPTRMEDALSPDFVAPDVARLFTADLPHAFLVWDRADRAEMLERGWENAWPDRGTGGPTDPAARGLSRGLRALWNATHGGTRWATPVLALNGISVEDGCRFLASAVDFTLPREVPDDVTSLLTAPTSADDRPDDAACRGPQRDLDAPGVDALPTTSELVDYLCPSEDVPLATAAHISARFPYASPTGRIARTKCPGMSGPIPGLVPESAVSFDADGGIFDNSGAGTLTDAWRALSPLVAAQERQEHACYAPIFVQIDNSPPASTVSIAPDQRPGEFLAPVNATLGQVSSRESYARSRAAAAFTRPVSPSGRSITFATGVEPETLWFRISLFGQPGPEPPLGWTLAPETVSDMRSQLRAEQNAQQLSQIRALLVAGALTCA